LEGLVVTATTHEAPLKSASFSGVGFFDDEFTAVKLEVVNGVSNGLFEDGRNGVSRATKSELKALEGAIDGKSNDSLDDQVDLTGRVTKMSGATSDLHIL